jgi:hypothetical protein
MAASGDGHGRTRGEFCYFAVHAVTWTLADATTQTSLGGRSGAWCALLLVLPHRHWASIADSAVRSRLRCVKACTAVAAPCHMPAVARTPYGADRPNTVAVLVAVRAARRRHDDPAALGRHEVADEVVREVVATRNGHGDVVPQ